jgi:hypothetical protein
MNANEISLKANARMTRIRKVSKIVRAVLLAGLIVQILAMAVGFMVLPLVFSHSLEVKSHVAFKNCSALLALPFAFMVTLNFFRFFSRLKDGRLFEAQTVKHLENAGKWWIVLGLAQIVFQFFEAYIFSPGDITISGNGIVAGLIVFFVAWLFGEAQKLQEEQELTV